MDRNMNAGCDHGCGDVRVVDAGLTCTVLLETDTQWTQSSSKMDGQYKDSR